MPTQSYKKTTSKKIDLLYISLGIITVSIIGIAIFNTPNSQPYAGAQTNPTSPGGGKVELPKSSPVKAEDPKPVNNPVIVVPTPDAPSTDVEEIDEAGNSTTIVVDNGGNLKPPINQPSTAIKNEPVTNTTTGVETTKTVRSGGSAVWVTILVVLVLAGATYYYKKKGNRKSNFKMTEK